MLLFSADKEICPWCAAAVHIFSHSVSLSSLSAGCKKHSALKDLRNSAIVLNLNGFGAQRTDGCVHSQIRRSIVQNPLFSLSNRTLSFSHCCLLQPLYHSTSLHTLYMYSCKHTSRGTHCFTLFHSLTVSLTLSR